MIDIIHIPISEALATARIIIQTLGPDHELSIKWINAVAKYGYRWRTDIFIKSV